MGVYSPSMLLHFPEQFRQFTYFDMTPAVNSGYTVVGTPVTYFGILQNAASSIKESNGNLINSNHENMWFDGKLDRGKFVQFDDIVFRIVNGNDWPSEGGFYSYTLQRLVGDNGTVSTVDWTPALGGTPV